jgi:hypothetical protein
LLRFFFVGFWFGVFGVCFVGGGLLPLLEVASPERPGKPMAKGKAVIDGVMIRNESEGAQCEEKSMRSACNDAQRYEIREAENKGMNEPQPRASRVKEEIVTKEDESATIRNDAVDGRNGN